MSVSQGTAHTLLSRAADAPGRDEGYWRRRAACRGEDPELFFPVGSAGSAALAQIAEAKKICARCPVRRACLVFAMATRQEYGIWGGLTEDERSQLRRRVAASQTAAVPAAVGWLPRKQRDSDCSTEGGRQPAVGEAVPSAEAAGHRGDDRFSRTAEAVEVQRDRL